MSVAMHTVGVSRTVSILDVSQTGAKLRCAVPLEIGQEVWLQASQFDVFGTIVWIGDGLYGVAFDESLSAEEAVGLQARGKVMLMPRLTLEEQLAVEDWKNGFVR